MQKFKAFMAWTIIYIALGLGIWTPSEEEESPNTNTDGK
jgi:hypothetical protein